MYHWIIKEAIEFIEENLAKPIKINDLLKKVSYSQAQFYIIFQIYTGMSVKQYIKKRRLTEVAKELKNTNKNIIDIAFKYQYNSHESLTRAFKKEFGITPNQYRKNNIQLNLFEKIHIDKRNVVDKIISDFNIKDYNKMQKQIKESLNRLENIGFFNNYNIDYTEYILEVELNVENILKYLESLPLIPLPELLYHSNLVQDASNREQLEIYLALMMKVIDNENWEELALEGVIRITSDEIDYYLELIHNFYDLDNPTYDGISMYYYKVKEDIIKELKEIKNKI